MQRHVLVWSPNYKSESVKKQKSSCGQNARSCSVSTSPVSEHNEREVNTNQKKRDLSFHITVPHAYCVSLKATQKAAY